MNKKDDQEIARIIAEGEEYIKKHGMGIVPRPNLDKRELEGIRYIPELEKRLGRPLTDEEWFGMSIR